MYYVLSVVLYLVLFNVYVLFVMCFLAVTCEVFSVKLKLTISFSLTSSSLMIFETQNVVHKMYINIHFTYV